MEKDREEKTGEKAERKPTLILRDILSREEDEEIVRFKKVILSIVNKLYKDAAEYMVERYLREKKQPVDLDPSSVKEAKNKVANKLSAIHKKLLRTREGQGYRPEEIAEEAYEEVREQLGFDEDDMLLVLKDKQTSKDLKSAVDSGVSQRKRRAKK